MNAIIVRFLGLIISFSFLFAFNSDAQSLVFSSTESTLFLNSPPTPALIYSGISSGGVAVAAVTANDSILFVVSSAGEIRREDNSVLGNIGVSNYASEIEVCPVPGNPSQFYIFYAKDQNHELYYSIVDLILNNGVVTITDNYVSNQSDDYKTGLEIVKNNGANGFWLIVPTHDFVGVKVFEIINSGINLVSTYSFANINTGSNYIHGEIDCDNGRCFLLSNGSNGGPVVVFDFDSATGAITNDFFINNIENPFGGEFSPDGSKLYITSDGLQSNFNNLHQHDFITGTTTSHSIFNPNIGLSGGFGQIETGPDGDLYAPVRGGGSHILKISNPNSLAFSFSSLPTDVTIDFGLSNVLDFSLSLEVTSQDVTCVGYNDGTATISISGGVEPYNILWDHDNSLSELTLSNLAPGEYVVFVTDALGTMVSGSVSISSPDFIEFPSFGVQSNQICLGDSASFFCDIDNSPFTDFLWSFGDGQNSGYHSPSHLYSSPGVYDISLYLTYNNNCVIDSTIYDFISVFTKPNALFSSNNINENCNLSVNFFNSSSNSSTFLWNFGDGQTSSEINPSIVYGAPGSYHVQLIALSGFCSDTTYLDVPTSTIPTLFVPNAFSPNNDGINDLFYAKGLCFESFDLKIYNNWGGLVFQTDNNLVGWDGSFKEEPCPIGSYVWCIYYKGKNNLQKVERGVVVLVR